MTPCQKRVRVWKKNCERFLSLAWLSRKRICKNEKRKKWKEGWIIWKNDLWWFILRVAFLHKPKGMVDRTISDPSLYRRNPRSRQPRLRSVGGNVKRQASEKWISTFSLRRPGVSGIFGQFTMIVDENWGHFITQAMLLFEISYFIHYEYIRMRHVVWFHLAFHAIHWWWNWRLFTKCVGKKWSLVHAVVEIE